MNRIEQERAEFVAGLIIIIAIIIAAVIVVMEAPR
jgi:hypothetical protein